MEFDIIHIQKDKSADCYSVLTVVSATFFLKYILPVHKDKGTLEEQRDVLQTRSAKIIRKQMVEDLNSGGILPPIVLGNIYSGLVDENNFHQLITSEDVYILDGMQRIQALRDASELNGVQLRVEFWFAPDETALLYRMLVLNSGQIPWSVDKQLEVVFKPIIKRIEREIHSNEYRKPEMVELFLAFTSRKVKIDKKQQLAEYHSALDIMGLLQEKQARTLERFIKVLKYLTEFDCLFSEVEDLFDNKNRFIFNNQTARVGFVVACSEKIYGLLGNNQERHHDTTNRNFLQVDTTLDTLERSIRNKTAEQRLEFLKLDTLEEYLVSIPKQRQRQAFADGFKGLFRGEEINSLAVCWNRMA
ncbi:MAG: hypothetical protein AAF827_00040 [Cyanobacteria bacterium P01_D01_bin.6]